MRIVGFGPARSSLVTISGAFFCGVASGGRSDDSGAPSGGGGSHSASPGPSGSGPGSSGGSGSPSGGGGGGSTSSSGGGTSGGGGSSSSGGGDGSSSGSGGGSSSSGRRTTSLTRSSRSTTPTATTSATSGCGHRNSPSWRPPRAKSSGRSSTPTSARTKAPLPTPPSFCPSRYCGGIGLSTITELPSWPCSVFSWNSPWAVITLTSSASGALCIWDTAGGRSSGNVCRNGRSSQG